MTLTKARVDDYGTIGGVDLHNNSPCDSVSHLMAEVLVDFQKDDDFLYIGYGAESEDKCGPPTSVQATVVLEWVPK